MNNTGQNHDGQYRARVRKGSVVEVIQKHHQKTGEKTRGIVDSVLTTSSFHTHGIKVRLDNGKIGRVSAILKDDKDP